MKTAQFVHLSFAILLCAASARAELPPEKLLPANTLAVFTVPDVDRANASCGDSAMSRMWRDPAMKPFADKFANKFREDVLAPIERELGVKLGDYAGLAHGQVTLALTQTWQGKGKTPGVVFLADAKDKSDSVKKILADLRKKWADGGKQMKSEKVRDAEFTVLVNAGQELGKSLEKAFPNAKSNKDENAKADDKSELLIGQSGSLFLMSNSRGDLEKILARQSGGIAPALGEQPAYEANHSSLFRDAIFYGWLDAKTLIDMAIKEIAAKNPDGGDNNPLGLKPQAAVNALGFGGLKTLAFHLNQSKDGTLVNFFLGVPEADRKGLFKLIVMDSKESAPPAFVPADVTKFVRFRLDGQKFWTTIEATVNEMSPQLGALMQLGLANAGKEKDPNFDFKKQIIGNLGNDVVIMQKAPRSAKLSDLATPPQLFLIASPKPEDLIGSLRTIIGSFNAPKERELLGRKVYSVELPASFGPDGKPVERSISFTASGAYAAVSLDSAFLEEYLRSAENKPRPLSETSGLNEAAQKVGGMNTGWFGYENEAETLRILLDALKQDPNYLEKLFSVPGVPAPGLAAARGFKEWFDFGLLPTWDKLAKYFYYTVQASSTGPDGISFKTFVPTPPGVK
ncbi:MAG: hypothetical protein HY300_06165 [Verrucomicrobia bacterium]|nr:hypothetical protein [Verrucomicrobiota bacterium]